MSEIVILRPTRGQPREASCNQPRQVKIRVLLEDNTDTYGRVERRLAAYELDNSGAAGSRIGYLPKDTPRREGNYLTTLHRPEGKWWIKGRLSQLNEHSN